VDRDVGPLEDAALVRPDSGPTLAFTVDFITPIVDDPETFGAIAAANAISDVYAMGGEPQVALAVCGYPRDLIGLETLERIFRGGAAKAAEAGCAIVGGHTVIDAELKYGLCVIGRVEPGRALSHTHARPGDVLVLTKPLGIGVASQAIKQERLASDEIALAVRCMSALNRGARDAALAAGARAATDVTGFGLLGHLHHLLLGAKAAARLRAGAVPLLPFAARLAAEGLVPGGSRRNLEYAGPWTRFAPDVDPVSRALLADAQTSGGLLIAVRPERAAELVGGLERHGALARAVVGEIVEGDPGRVSVEAGG
jgi:selenide,water dikinase